MEKIVASAITQQQNKRESYRAALKRECLEVAESHGKETAIRMYRMVIGVSLEEASKALFG